MIIKNNEYTSQVERCYRVEMDLYINDAIIPTVLYFSGGSITGYFFEELIIKDSTEFSKKEMKKIIQFIKEEILINKEEQ